MNTIFFIGLLYGTFFGIIILYCFCINVYAKGLRKTLSDMTVDTRKTRPLIHS